MVSVALLGVALAASVACRRSGSASATHSSAALAAAEPDDWMNQWHKQTFDGQDARKLWDQFAHTARAELSKPGADPSDLSARAHAIGADPEKVFEFMRDQITLEPYAGVLRGARGTLLARAGNALDRALLAKELLRLNGIESRLVRGRLSDAQTDTLLARFLGASQVPQVLADLIAPPNEPAMKEQAAAFARTFGIPEKASVSLADHARTDAQDFWTKANAQSSTHLDSLASSLRQTSLKLAVDAGSLTAELSGRLRDHYWLQVREPNGGWTDFDAAFADPQRGSAHGSRAVALSDVPDSLYHKLAIGLIYETMTDGAPREDTVVSGVYASAEALFQSIEFHIQPIELGADPDALIALDPKAKVALLRNVKRFQGLLSAGGTVIAGRKFDFEGNTYDANSGPALPQPAGTFADALGGSESAVRFVELRVVLCLTGPGRAPLIQRRVLVRGPDVASGTFAPPMLEWDVLLQPQWMPSDFVALRTLDEVIGMGDALIRASQGDRSLATARSPKSASPLALQMAVLRETAVARILAARSGVRAFIEAPLLTIAAHQVASIDDKQAAITVERSFDIVENGVRYVPLNDAAAPTAFEAALSQGVADCTLEDRFLRETFPRSASKSGMTILEQANLEKRPVLLAKTQDIDALRSSGVTEADIEWIHDNELPDSRLVVATTASGSDAWWSVRPNGMAVLRTNGGRGQGKVELAITTWKVGMALLCVSEIGLAIAEKHTFGEVENGTAVGVVLCVAGTALGFSTHALASSHSEALLIEGTFLFMDLFFHLGVQLSGEPT
jgi:transglutaminase-like putative cysteine protease